MLRTQQNLSQKSTSFYYNSVSPIITRACQVHQALPVHLDPKECGDEGDKKEGPETREIEVLWDHQERVASKALWGLRALRETLEPKDKKETEEQQACRELKDSLVNPFNPLLLLFLL